MMLLVSWKLDCKRITTSSSRCLGFNVSYNIESRVKEMEVLLYLLGNVTAVLRKVILEGTSTEAIILTPL